ncbi:hypothetical protein DFR70_103651 [Nocardia tenerifensis]|uniref:Uncharacterized protein n=1 Tax=Nocardia tenerifensis TaxID=228006 RepID=A0A318KA77_9NOCA|nr:hypothetical protein [Nocardia tenerifensis]PXX66896.1 hypothetical protein DFR70_103651 [Nocardia tenerifensis]
MAEYYKGRRVSTPEEEGFAPLSQEEKDAVDAMFDEFNAKRAAGPPEKRLHLSSRFGDDDFNNDDVPRNPDGSRKDRNPS